MCRNLPAHLEFFDHHRSRIRQFLTEQAEQFFPHQLCGEKSLRAVRDFVLFMLPGAFRKIRLEYLPQVRNLRTLCRADRHDLGKRECLAGFGDKRQQNRLVGKLVDLVDDQDYRDVLGQQREQLAVFTAELHGFDDEQHDIHAIKALRHRAVHQAVQLAAMLGLEARRVDQHHLRVRLGHDAIQTMARGLRAVRCNADLHTDHAIKQCRLADVRPADDGDAPAAMRHGFHLRATASS